MYYPVFIHQQQLDGRGAKVDTNEIVRKTTSLDVSFFNIMAISKFSKSAD